MEITDELLDKMMVYLRIKNDSAKLEIEGLINSCILHLRIAGVYATTLSDPLVLQAIKLYCKWHFGYDEDTERFEKAYNALRDSMKLSGDYEKEDES